jgi:hypothetical protein
VRELIAKLVEHDERQNFQRARPRKEFQKRKPDRRGSGVYWRSSAISASTC